MSNITGFHASDGWFFSRLEGGLVRIQHFICRPTDEGGPYLDREYSLPENVWASVVCAVSDKGEDYERWMQARRFHGLKEGACR